MMCEKCGSDRMRIISAEILIHLPGPKNIDKPGLFLFPRPSICLHCGHVEFAIPADKIPLLDEAIVSTSE